MRMYTVIRPQEPHYRYLYINRMNKPCWVSELRGATELPKADAILFCQRYPDCAVLTYNENWHEIQITRY
jgi:hypothetical protein